VVAIPVQKDRKRLELRKVPSKIYKVILRQLMRRRDRFKWTRRASNMFMDHWTIKWDPSHISFQISPSKRTRKYLAGKSTDQLVSRNCFYSVLVHKLSSLEFRSSVLPQSRVPQGLEAGLKAGWMISNIISEHIRSPHIQGIRGDCLKELSENVIAERRFQRAVV